MDELEPRAEQLLAAFRADDAFDAPRRAAVRRRLARSLERPTPSWVDELGTDDGKRRAAPPRYWWWGVAAAVVIASVAVLGWRGRATQLDGPNPDAAADRATRERGATARQGAPSSASGTARPSLPTAPQPQPAPPSPSPGSPAGAAVMPPPATTPSRPSQGLRRPGPRRATPTNPTGPGEPPSGELSLGRELAAIDAVNAALRTNDLKQAAAALARYEQEFPRGQLRAEARALRIIVDCRRGASGAHVAAERFQRREPNSVLAERVTAACNRAAP